MRRVRAPLVLVAVLSVAVATVLALVVTGRSPDRDAPPTAAPSTDPSRSGTALPAGPDLAARFVDAYVDADGRVVRRDQGGDTVSEGQAYAMLLAVAADDEDTFDRVWGWTRTNLARPDGLLSWTWADGAVVDANSAADADVDAAHALVVAGERFGRPDLTGAGKTLATAVLDHETAETSLGRVLLAGQWAKTEPYRVNPSYSAPAAYAVLGRATGDARWAQVADGDRAVLGALLDQAPLPPDWAQVRSDGTVDAMPPPGGGDVAYGLDAQRIAVRYAASCDTDDRALVGRLGGAVPTASSDVRGVYDLGGTARVDWQHPVALVSAAAVSDAEGASGAAGQLLRAAADLDTRASTYYGAAWAALGEDLLEDPTTLGITCREQETR
ncbi:glycosyl hydrolase family 8 [Phycicoccus avicenniae]|uniref:glycosyl hydrolase family 8 n=1 Tax=Phycicoccus avicenniae TaxID=2828860 RepID=UPI003D29D8A1